MISVRQYYIQITPQLEKVIRRQLRLKRNERVYRIIALIAQSKRPKQKAHT